MLIAIENNYIRSPYESLSILYIKFNMLFQIARDELI
jgi:hypothetical protein